MFKVAHTGQKQNKVEVELGEVEVHVSFIGEQGRHEKQGSVHLRKGFTVRKSKGKCSANIKFKKELCSGNSGAVFLISNFLF